MKELGTIDILVHCAGVPKGDALFLAFDASSMVTGTVLNMDGGYRAR